jgi:hypothetical protein
MPLVTETDAIYEDDAFMESESASGESEAQSCSESVETSADSVPGFNVADQPQIALMGLGTKHDEGEADDACSTQASEQCASFEHCDEESMERLVTPPLPNTEPLAVSIDDIQEIRSSPKGKNQQKKKGAKSGKSEKGVNLAQQDQFRQWQAAQYQAQAAHYQAAQAQFQMMQLQAARVAQWQQAQVVHQAAYAAQVRAHQAMQWQMARRAQAQAQP